MAVASPALSTWSEVDWDETSTCLDLDHNTEADDYDSDDSWHILSGKTLKPQIIAITVPPAENLPSQCEHWATRNCHLTATHRRCCACVDTRPRTKDGLYETYVDGRGFVREASRHEHYCPGCSVNPLRTDTAETITIEPTTTETKISESSVITQTTPTLKKALKTPSKHLQAQREAAAKIAHQVRQMARGLLFQRTRCKHWVERDCELRATEGKCCECIDKRPADTDYTVYIDGMGRLSGAEKYRHYCAGCKLVFEAQDGLAVSAGMPMDLEQFKWREFIRKKKRATQHQQTATAVNANLEKEKTSKTARTMTRQQQRIEELKKDGAHANGGCIHWQGFGCKLKGPRCCACMDDRTHAERYIKYVDGEGDVMAARRWEYYCPLCRKAGEVMDEKGMNDRSYIAMLSMGRV